MQLLRAEAEAQIAASQQAVLEAEIEQQSTVGYLAKG
jgi:hypothetical protein